MKNIKTIRRVSYYIFFHKKFIKIFTKLMSLKHQLTFLIIQAPIRIGLD